jgi:dynein heavy chain 2
VVQQASIQKSEAEKYRPFLIAEEAKIKHKKESVAMTLAEVGPIVEAAKANVKSISKGNLDELRSYKMAPAPVIDVFTALLRLMGQYDNSWSAIRKFLGQRSIIDEIVDFDAGSVPPETRIDVEKYIKTHAKSFEKSVIYHVSQAAGPLAEYVKAVVKLAETLNKIAPLQNELDEVEEKLIDSREKLAECEQKVKTLDAKVNQYKLEFNKMTSEAQGLSAKLKKAEDTLSKAENLLSKLSEEKGRWKTQLEEIETQFTNLPIDSLLAAAFCTY